jgi:transcriptional regulator with XRE-family HTH domain
MNSIMVKELRKKLGISQEKFAEILGVHLRTIQNWEKGGVIPNAKHVILHRIEAGLNIDIPISKEEMIKNSSDNVQFYEPENVSSEKKLIPLYDDVSTIGGNLPGYSANMESNSQPAEWIDPGDWFKNATAAIRHYGDSMTEYPPGCILALREVRDRRLIVPGKDYVIETSEYRVTKKMQVCDNPEYIRVRSTNKEKYDDGTLMYEPFNIPLSLIGRLFEVLGYVVKKGGGTIVFNNQNK